MDAIEAGSSELGAASGTHNFERDFGHCCVVGMDAGGGNEWKLHKLPHILHVYCIYHTMCCRCLRHAPDTLCRHANMCMNSRP